MSILREERALSKFIKGISDSGFEFSLDSRRLNNYELVEVMAEVDSNPLLLPKVVHLLFGEDEKRLKDHVRDEEGLIDTDKLFKEVFNIIMKANETKN